jgi:SAM-dependent methyltransferase
MARSPPTSASLIASEASRDLPTPASPDTTTIAPRPPAAIWAAACAIVATSAARPISVGQRPTCVLTGSVSPSAPWSVDDNGPVAQDDGYLLDNQQAEAGQRFDALSALFNPSTFRHLSAAGLTRGWRVWEVGAGGPSVPAWLAAEVGPAGRVLATDIDTSWLKACPASVEIRRDDIGSDDAPEGPFDLIHARLLLVHVQDRTTALATMVSSLAPGGVLVLEEADPALQPLACPDEFGVEEQLANKLKNGFRALLSARGVDLAYGRTLPRLMRQAGLLDVRSDAYFPIGGPACTELERATTEQIRTRLVEAELATDEEIDQHLANIATDRIDLATSPMISAWGRAG